MADIFDVIADSTRRDILQLLLRRSSGADESASVSQIVEELGVSQPTVSKHLKVLRENDLVHVREEGQRRYYSLASEPLEQIDDWLVPFFVDEEELAEEVATATAALPANLPDSAARAAESLGRAAASAKSVVQSALRRIGAQ